MWIEIFDTGLLLGSLAALVSGLIQGYSGFAGGLIIVPILAILFSPIEAIAIAAIAALAGSMALITNAVKNADWRETGSVSVAIAISIPLGLLFLVSTDPLIIRRGMGIFILFAAFLLMSGWTYKGTRGHFAGGLTGATSGLVMGAFGVPAGLIFVVYFLSAPVPIVVQRANIIIVVFVALFFLLGGLIVQGAYTAETLARTIIIAPLYLAGSLSGKKLFQIAPAAWFKKAAYTLLLASGLAVLLA